MPALALAGSQARGLRTPRASSLRGPCAVPSPRVGALASCSRARRACVRVRAEGEESVAKAKVYPVPRGPEETVQQALEAVKNAYADGIKRQNVEMLLPLIGATDLDDWPGGIQQQFKAAQPMVESMLKDLKVQETLEGALAGEILDQGDAVGAWSSDALAAILFPSAATLKKIKSIAEGKELMLLINAQWKGGQVISDFGIGPWRAANEEFVNSFDDTYYLAQFRMLSEDVRILRVYPNDYQVHVMNYATQEAEYVTSMDHRPEYSELEPLLISREGSNASKTWVERLQDEIVWTQNSLTQSPQNRDPDSM